jgi:hypothetical protein
MNDKQLTQSLEKHTKADLIEEKQNSQLMEKDELERQAKDSEILEWTSIPNVQAKNLVEDDEQAKALSNLEIEKHHRYIYQHLSYRYQQSLLITVLFRIFFILIIWAAVLFFGKVYFNTISSLFVFAVPFTLYVFLELLIYKKLMSHLYYDKYEIGNY